VLTSQTKLAERLASQPSSTDTSWISPKVVAFLRSQKATLQQDADNQIGKLQTLADLLLSESHVGGEIVPSVFLSRIPQSIVLPHDICVPQTHCGCCGFPLEFWGFNLAAGTAVDGSSLCSVCYSPWARIGIVAQVVLEQIVVVRQTLSVTQRLLSAVCKAIVLFLSRLRTARTSNNGIAISQREFFTHHGAHPPIALLTNCSELFLERANQLSMPV